MDDPSPINQPKPVQQLRIDTDGSNDNVAIEDDELELQIQLGKAQQRTLRMQIEHKRRRASNTTTPSDGGGFNLTQELSFEIEQSRIAKRAELKAHNEALQQQLVHFQTQQAQQISTIRAEMQAELELVKSDIRTQYVNQVEAKATENRQDYQQAIVKVQEQAAMRVNLMKQELATELGNKTRDANQFCVSTYAMKQKPTFPNNRKTWPHAYSMKSNVLKGTLNNATNTSALNFVPNSV